MAELIGQVYNGYTIKSKLGSGGQSAAYLASHEKYDEDVALRAILPEFSDDPETIKRFQIEAAIFFRLKHPNIVPLLDYWHNDTGTFLVQKYMAGGSLRDKINAPRIAIPKKKIADLLTSVGQALEYTHSHNIIHRDIKPGNILFDENDVAYVHDFGVAKRLESEEITRSDVMVGSPALPITGNKSPRNLSPHRRIYTLWALPYLRL